MPSNFLTIVLLTLTVGWSASAVDDLPRSRDATALEPGAAELILRNARTIPEDFARISLGVFENPVFDLVLVGGTGLLLAFDKPITTFLQDKVTPAVSFLNLPSIIETPITHGADGWVVGISGAWYLASLMTGSKKGQLAGIWAFKGAVYSYFYSQLVLKSLFGRNRPNPHLSAGSAVLPYTDSPYDWGHVHGPQFASDAGATSFPSFHFTLYYSVATAFARAYDNAWIPYSLATLAALSNFGDHNHWASDMYAGAVIGIGIGSVLANNYLRRFATQTKDPEHVEMPPQVFFGLQDRGFHLLYHQAI